MSTAARRSIDRAPSSNRWERTVPVYGFPVVNGFFLGLFALVLIAFALTGVSRTGGTWARSAE